MNEQTVYEVVNPEHPTALLEEKVLVAEEIPTFETVAEVEEITNN